MEKEPKKERVELDRGTSLTLEDYLNIARRHAKSEAEAQKQAKYLEEEHHELRRKLVVVYNAFWEFEEMMLCVHEGEPTRYIAGLSKVPSDNKWLNSRPDKKEREHLVLYRL